MDGSVLPPGTYVKVAGNLRSFQVRAPLPPPERRSRPRPTENGSDKTKPAHTMTFSLLEVSPDATSV